jgi:hypothetical protein
MDAGNFNPTRMARRKRDEVYIALENLTVPATKTFKQATEGARVLGAQCDGCQSPNTLAGKSALFTFEFAFDLADLLKLLPGQRRAECLQTENLRLQDPVCDDHTY